MDPIQGSQAPQGESSQKPSGSAQKKSKPVSKPASTSANKSANNNDANNFMSSLTEAEYTYKRPKFGDIVQGVVVRAAPHEVLVDIGTKSEAIIAPKEVEELAREGKRPQLGEEVLAYVIKSEDQDGLT